MNKTLIEWTDFTWNPVTGCLNDCPYCYARKIAIRFKGTKAWPKGFEPVIHWGRMLQPWSPRTPSRIFVCSMGELFGDWVPDEWIKGVMASVRCNPQHTFQFLTKCPWNLPKWNPWPDNAQVGVTATTASLLVDAEYWLRQVVAKVRFASLEPFLDFENFLAFLPTSPIDWLIIGAQTNPYLQPELEQVQEVIEGADRVGIPVFLKNNLHLDVSGKDTWALSPNVGKGELWRQEFPKRGAR